MSVKKKREGLEMTARCIFYHSQFRLFMLTKNEVLSNQRFQAISSNFEKLLYPPIPCLIPPPLSICAASGPVHIAYSIHIFHSPSLPPSIISIPNYIHIIVARWGPSTTLKYLEKGSHLKKQSSKFENPKITKSLTKNICFVVLKSSLLLNEKNPGPTNHVLEQREDFRNKEKIVH